MKLFSNLDLIWEWVSDEIGIPTDRILEAVENAILKRLSREEIPNIDILFEQIKNIKSMSFQSHHPRDVDYIYEKKHR
jgi:hypothetical protein